MVRGFCFIITDSPPAEPEANALAIESLLFSRISRSMRISGEGQADSDRSYLRGSGIVHPWTASALLPPFDVSSIYVGRPAFVTEN